MTRRRYLAGVAGIQFEPTPVQLRWMRAARLDILPSETPDDVLSGLWGLFAAEPTHGGRWVLTQEGHRYLRCLSAAPRREWLTRRWEIPAGREAGSLIGAESARESDMTTTYAVSDDTDPYTSVVYVCVDPPAGERLTPAGMQSAERDAWIAAMELTIAIVRRLPLGHPCMLPTVSCGVTLEDGARAVIELSHDGDEAALRALHEAVEAAGKQPEQAPRAPWSRR